MRGEIVDEITFQNAIGDEKHIEKKFFTCIIIKKRVKYRETPSIYMKVVINFFA